MNLKIISIVTISLVVATGVFFMSEKYFGQGVLTPTSDADSQHSGEYEHSKGQNAQVRDTVSVPRAEPMPAESGTLTRHKDSAFPKASADPAVRRNLRFRSVLASENKLIFRSQEGTDSEELLLDAPRSQLLLTDDDEFNQAMESFSSDELGSSEAIELADSYREIFAAYDVTGQNDTMFSLQNISCGHSICLGSVQTDQSGETWSGFLDYFDSMAGAFSVFAEHSVPIGDEIVEYRFLFSTDPNIIGAMAGTNSGD